MNLIVILTPHFNIYQSYSDLAYISDLLTISIVQVLSLGLGS